MLLSASMISIDVVILGILIISAIIAVNALIYYLVIQVNEGRRNREDMARSNQELSNKSFLIQTMLWNNISGVNQQKEIPSPIVMPQIDSDSQLTKREMEVAELLSKGLKAKQIADALFVSKHTVNNHVANILRKTNCSNKAQFVAYAIRNKLFN